MGHAASTTRTPRGFSIVEVAVSLVVVGVMMVAALGAVGTAARTDQLTMDSSRGRLLAEELMAEIMLKAYSEPSGGAAAIGANTGEVVANSRALYDDVDDYDGWVESPCRQADGTAIAGTTGWTRRVAVAWVSATDPATVSATDSGVKRIVVEVARDGRTVAQLTALRTRAWPQPPYLP